MLRNCPNCGAECVGLRCEYCGTPVYDASDILNESLVGKKIHIWVEDEDGCLGLSDLVVESLSIEHQFETLYGDITGELHQIALPPHVYLSGIMVRTDLESWKRSGLLDERIQDAHKEM